MLIFLFWSFSLIIVVVVGGGGDGVCVCLSEACTAEMLPTQRRHRREACGCVCGGTILIVI